MRLVVLILSLLAATSVVAEEVDFTLPDIMGKDRSLSEFRGKWVIVNFWATWCPPCLEEIPDLVDFHERHKDTDAVVVGINYEAVDPAYLKEFVENHFITYPVLAMDPLPVTPLGPVMGLPTTYIISPAGERMARQEGPVTMEAIEKYLERKQEQQTRPRVSTSMADPGRPGAK